MIVYRCDACNEDMTGVVHANPWVIALAYGNSLADLKIKHKVNIGHLCTKCEIHYQHSLVPNMTARDLAAVVNKENNGESDGTSTTTRNTVSKGSCGGASPGSIADAQPVGLCNCAACTCSGEE